MQPHNVSGRLPIGPMGPQADDPEDPDAEDINKEADDDSYFDLPWWLGGEY